MIDQSSHGTNTLDRWDKTVEMCIVRKSLDRFNDPRVKSEDPWNTHGEVVQDSGNISGEVGHASGDISQKLRKMFLERSNNL